MTTDDPRILLRSAIAAIRGCADTMEAQGANLQQALPRLPVNEALRPAVLGLASGLKDTAGRVTFELALLEAEISEGRVDAADLVQRLSNMDSSMMMALDGIADVAGQLEKSAEDDERLEPAFAFLMQAARLMLSKFGDARTATEVLVAGNDNSHS
jgi:hypothetical protein